MRPALLVPLLALAVISSGFAFESSREEVVALDHAKAMIDDGATVIVVPCCGTKPIALSDEDLRAIRDRKTYLLVPVTQSPFDVRVRVKTRTPEFSYRDIRIEAADNENISLWWTEMHSSTMKRDDYFVSLKVGGFESRAIGTLDASNDLNWRQNNEYRLVSLSAPLDPADPHFSLILEDQLLVTVTTVANPRSFIPTIRPTASLHPANLGFSMAGGRRTRYKVSVGAGYALSALPFAAPETATQGFLRLQIRFK
ncbi:MAG: hypothetical protein JST04_07770 [Bdellovibrionales bacterium]|nr:hypothetical protein [Bdellovibrionales bacterium]